MISNTLDTLRDDRAVSPVIGVILMVAITVILAAVIGTFVLGLGQDMSQTAPTAQIQLEDGDSTGNVTIVHNGGDKLTTSDLTVLVNGTAETGVTFNASDGSPKDTLAAGEEAVIQVGSVTGVDDSDEINLRVRHDPSEAIIAEGTVTVGST